MENLKNEKQNIIARQNMIENQIKPQGITKSKILNAIYAIPREKFVPKRAEKFAYSETNIPLETKYDEKNIRYIMNPVIFAKIIHRLDIQKNHIVLDIACAKGYSTAIIAQLAESVVSIEDNPVFAREAQKNLDQNNINNAVIINAKLAQGYPKGAPYDAVFIQGAVQKLPQNLIKQIKENGKIALIIQNPLQMPYQRQNHYILKSNIENYAVQQAVIYQKQKKLLRRITHFDANMPNISEFNITNEEFVF